jgi:AcrR family transcriptional regulator
MRAVLSRRQPAAREARKSRLEERLLEAVEGLLSDGHAYADLSVSAIAAAAGISRTTFYDYVGDKRQLLLSLGGRVTRDLVEAAAIWEPKGGDLGAEQLREVLRLFPRTQPKPASSGRDNRGGLLRP